MSNDRSVRCRALAMNSGCDPEGHASVKSELKRTATLWAERNLRHGSDCSVSTLGELPIHALREEDDCF